MNRKVVRKSLIYFLFAVLLVISVSALFGLNYSGKTVLYSSSSSQCSDSGGICRSSCLSNEHPVGSKDCKVSTIVSGSSSSTSSASISDSEEAPEEGSVLGGSGDFCGDESCNGDETCLSCSEDCGSCSPSSGGASPAVLKDEPLGEVGLSIYDITGLASSSPVCCVPNECYTNSDCPANKYCSYYECVENKELNIEGIKQANDEFIYYNLRQGYTFNYDSTYNFEITRFSYILNKISFTFNSEEYTVSKDLPVQLDLDGDNVYEIQISLSRIDKDNSCVITIKTLENNLQIEKSPEIEAPNNLQEPIYERAGSILVFLIRNLV